MKKLVSNSRILEIDKYNLDEECATHPQKYNDAAREAARCSKEEKEAERKYIKMKAKVGKEVRKRPGKFGVDPDEPKEGAIKGAIDLDGRVEEAYSEYLDARERAANAAADEKAYEHRRTLIKLLGELWMKDYYSSVEVREEREDKFRKSMGKRRRNANNSEGRNK